MPRKVKEAVDWTQEALESSPPLPSLYVASCPVDKDSEVFQHVVPSEAEALSQHKVFEHFQGT